MLQQFLDYMRFELNRAPLTVEAYELDIRQFKEWISPENPEATDFYSVTGNDVRSWLAFLAKSGDTPRTLRRKIISLRSLYKWLIKTGKMKISPIENVPLPKIPKPLPELIKPKEIEEAIANIDRKEPAGIMEALIVELFYTLGIRRAELVGLNDSDISFFKGEMKVTGKRSKQRIIPVPQNLLEKIKVWIEFRDQNLLDNLDPTASKNNIEKTVIENSPLFIVKGKRITPQQVYKIVNTALSLSTARKKSPHALRHSFASGMLNGGADIDSVREFLGHSSLSTTQIYTHISLNEIKRAYQAAHPRSEKEKK